MKPRDIIPLTLAAIGLATAAVERIDAMSSQQTTGHVDTSLRACLLTLEHVMEDGR